MRLIIDGRRLTAGRTGVGRYLELLLQDWAITGPPIPETLVVLRDRAGLAQVPGGSSIRAEVAGEGLPGLIWERFGLGRRLRPSDILFAPTNLVPAGWRGKTVLVMHDTLLESRPESFPWHVHWRFARRYRQAATRADRVLTPSQSTWRDVAKHYGVPASRLRVIYPAADPSFRPRGPASEDVREARARVGLGDAPFFLFVGKPSSRRNVPAILDAFAEHRASHPGHKLIFVGPGEVDLGPGASDGSILRAGHVPEPVLRGLMADALALLYPSDYEGFGLPILEALACGCPAITLRRGAMLEAGGDAAIYLDGPDPREMAKAMHLMATDINARASRMSPGIRPRRPVLAVEVRRRGQGRDPRRRRLPSRPRKGPKARPAARRPGRTETAETSGREMVSGAGPMLELPEPRRDRRTGPGEEPARLVLEDDRPVGTRAHQPIRDEGPVNQDQVGLRAGRPGRPQPSRPCKKPKVLVVNVVGIDRLATAVDRHLDPGPEVPDRRTRPSRRGGPGSPGTPESRIAATAPLGTANDDGPVIRISASRGTAIATTIEAQARDQADRRPLRPRRAAPGRSTANLDRKSPAAPLAATPTAIIARGTCRWATNGPTEQAAITASIAGSRRRRSTATSTNAVARTRRRRQSPSAEASRIGCQSSISGRGTVAVLSRKTT